MFHEELLPDEIFLKQDILCANAATKWVRPYKFESNEIEGRYLVASRDLEAGEPIMKEKSMLCGPQLSTKPICLACYRWVDGSYLCSKCGWPLCGKKCETKPGEHSTECKIFQSKKFSMKKDASKFKFDEVEPMYDVVPPLRALALRDQDPALWKLFWNLMSHYDNWMKDPEWKTSHQYIIDFLLDKLKLENVTERIILTIFGIFYTNDFCVRIYNNQIDVDNPTACSKIRVSYPLISMCSHDCVPNSVYDHVRGDQEPPEFEVVLKAKRPIKKGEKIFISYVDILLPTYIRQKDLLEGKKFLCQCKRCLDPTSLGTFGDAFLCKKCKFDPKTGTGAVIKASPNNWKCNKCKWEKSEEDIETLLQQIHKETDELLNDPKNNRVDLFEAFLKKYEKVLHPNHMFFCLVKYSLSGYYGRIPGFRMEEMTPDVVKRKRQICLETLEVIEKIDLGIGIRKGMLMYELHMPIIMLTQMQLQSGLLSRDQAKKEFNLALKYLKESLEILKHEPDGAFEKNVYYGAKDSVEPIKNFVQSI